MSVIRFYTFRNFFLKKVTKIFGWYYYFTYICNVKKINNKDMESFIITVGVIMGVLVIIAFILGVIFASVESPILLAGLFCALFTVLAVQSRLYGDYKSEMKPIDVYRGKTTLEITYRDSVPIDSVVVFK